MALVNEFLDRDSAERDRPVFGKSQRPFNRLMTFLSAKSPWTVFRAPGVDAFHNEFVNRMEVATLDFFLNQTLRIGLEVDRHRYLTGLYAGNSIIARPVE